MSDSTNTSATPYVGRHRDESQIGRALHFQREYRFKWFGYEYTPRHTKPVSR